MTVGWLGISNLECGISGTVAVRILDAITNDSFHKDTVFGDGTAICTACKSHIVDIFK